MAQAITELNVNLSIATSSKSIFMEIFFISIAKMYLN